MTLRGLTVTSLLAAAPVAAVLSAGEGTATARVSAAVVRPCRVTADQFQVSVACGAGAPPVRVSSTGRAETAPATASRPAPAPASARSVTIHF